MRPDQMLNQSIEIAREFPPPAAVTFNSERLCLEGIYADELSAYRAKRAWRDTLTSLFLLEQHDDFELLVDQTPDALFRVECQFLTACARYAFWRLTNQQAPEAQYMIETAHIPNSSSRPLEMMAAPDLTPYEAAHAPDSAIAPKVSSPFRRVRMFLKTLF